MARGKVPAIASLVPVMSQIMNPGGLARVISEGQRGTKEATRRLPKSEILNGALVEGIEVSTTAVRTPHGLDRLPVGWIIVDRLAAADIWRTEWDDRTITLDASASDTITIYVF